MAKLTFNRKPMPIFAEYRPLYKVVQLLMILSLSSRGGRSSIIRLQLFNWTLKSEQRRQRLLEVSKTGTLEIEVWGLDPALNAAIQFAIGEGLVKQNGAVISIENKGKEFLNGVLDDDLIIGDKEFLNTLGKNVTEGMVSKISESWG